MQELLEIAIGMRAAHLKSKRLLAVAQAHVVSNKLQGTRNNTFLRWLWLTVGHDLVLPITRNAGLRQCRGQLVHVIRLISGTHAKSSDDN